MEVTTLLGMTLVVGSLFLTWQHVTPPGAEILGGIALFRSRGPLVAIRNGFAAGVWQPLTLCAVTAGATLLWRETPQTRNALMAVQAACALACVVIPLARFEMRPGVLTALLGGALLMMGALGRSYGAAAPPAGSEP
jgi:hypothetical protein